MTLAALEAARATGVLREVDFYLAQHLMALDPQAGPPVALAIAALSQATAEGDVCLDLAAQAGAPLFQRDNGSGGILAPNLTDWLAALRESALVTSPTRPSTAPLVLDQHARLYLQKYYAFERAVVQDVEQRLAPADTTPPAALEAALTSAFPGRAPDDPQRLAAALAANRRFAVITGGPDTGKTTTVTRLLAALLALAGQTTPRIRLAAPTGKAAARLGESVQRALGDLHNEGFDGSLLSRLPTEAITLHRLLGWQPRGFRHHAGNRLPLDVLVVDEASMIDLPLFARLLDALPPTAQLVLLGDRDQLASVEAGSVLGDLCNRGAAAASPRAIAGSIAVLTHSHRFGADSGIGVLARATNAGDLPAVHAGFARDGDVRCRSIPAAELAAAVRQEIEPHAEHWRAASDPRARLDAFNSFRLLCALRAGPYGVERMNRLAEESLASAGLLDPRQRHYEGRPILITENDYGVGLFNGDTGLVLRDEEGVLRAFFPDGATGCRSLSLSRLPAHETCFAMTVHKSQGSEFSHVVLVLPEDDSPVLTRELVYTGLTRARQRLTVWASAARLEAAIGRQVTRRSGLREALWGE